MPLASLRRATAIDDEVSSGGVVLPSPRRVALPGKGAGDAPRRGLLAAAGAITVLLCTALGAAVASSSNQRRAYLAVAEYVPAGAPVAAADLRSVSVTPAAGLDAIPLADASAVVGRHAAVALEPGALLVTADLGQAAALPPTAALVGTSLAADQVPLGIQPGDHVLVLLGGPSAGLPQSGSAESSDSSGSAGSSGSASSSSTGARAAGSGSSTDVLARGVITAIDVPSSTASSGSELVTLEVSSAAAPGVAAASANGDISLAMVGAEPGTK